MYVFWLFLIVATEGKCTLHAAPFCACTRSETDATCGQSFVTCKSRKFFNTMLALMNQVI